jgi:hypothetical protein
MLLIAVIGETTRSTDSVLQASDRSADQCACESD